MGTANLEWSDHRRELLRFLSRKLDNHADREDIVQEAVVRLFLYQARPGIVIANVGAVLRRISLDLTRDHYRRKSVSRTCHLTDELVLPGASLHEQLEHQQLVKIVVGIVKAMPKLRREVFFRRRFEGLSAKETAAVLGISPGAVDAHVARAVLDLHRAVGKIEKRGNPS